jgi:quercetin dioxygenase-like cupin family protein
VRTKVVLFFGVGLLAIAGAALATPGVGILSATVQARGTVDDDHSIKRLSRELMRLAVQDGDTTDVVTQSISMAPGGTTGWHGHPGPVLVTVKSGELTIVYTDDKTCEGRTYKAGESFVDFGNVKVHTALNRTPVNVDVWATYLVPGAPGTAFRIDAPNTSRCTF